MKKTVHTVFPDVAIAPYILLAGSDARHMTKVCKCTLRFVPIRLTKEQFASVHNTKECIDLSVIGEAVTFYKTLIQNYI
ncbi:hypothetical protein [Niameybacter sp.]|uniref:hypothetical protein n=1 Tax=Niameybacter sp. TaxID=2033640 RepID=UPI002FC58EB8